MLEPVGPSSPPRVGTFLRYRNALTKDVFPWHCHGLGWFILWSKKGCRTSMDSVSWTSSHCIPWDHIQWLCWPSMHRESPTFSLEHSNARGDTEDHKSSRTRALLPSRLSVFVISTTFGSPFPSENLNSLRSPLDFAPAIWWDRWLDSEFLFEIPAHRK